MPPTVVGVNVIDAFTIRVIYSEPVEESGALVSTNYTFDNGLTASAVAKESDNTYMVTTSQQTSGISYTLTVSNVQDLFGNTI